MADLDETMSGDPAGDERPFPPPDALQARVVQLELALSATDTVTVVVDTVRRVSWASDAFARLHGWVQADVVGKGLDELGDPLARHIDAALDTSETDPEIVVRDPVSDRVWRCRVRRAADQVVVVASEETAQRRTGRDLQVLKQRLRIVAEAAPLVIFHSDRRCRVTWASGVFAGLDPRDVIGLTPTDLLGTPIAGLERLQRRVIRTGKGARREIDVGSTSWECWVEPERDEAGQVVGAVVAALDTTAWRAAEHAQRDLEARYRDTFEHAGVGVAHVASDGHILRVNPRMAAILGAPAEQLVGTSLMDLVHPEDWAAIERLEPPHGEARIRMFRADHSTATILLNVSSGRDPRTDSQWAIVVAQDVTAQHLAERQLKELTATLEQQVARRTARLERQAEVLRRLAADLTTTEQRERKRFAEMLHDHLQQYLVAARLKVGLARRRASDEVKPLLHDADGMLAEAVRSARTLTAELRPPVLYEDGLVPALRWLAGRFREQQGLEVGIDADPGAEPSEPHVRALLYAVVQELLLNVVKHAGVAAAEVRLSRSGPMLHVEVWDEGRGLDSDVLERDRGPAGFGLLSVRERVAAMDGRMELESCAGGGTRVHVFVPLTEAPEVWVADETTETQYTPPHRPGEAVRVLLADDHKIVREGLANLLEEQAGIQVIAQAADGQEAVALTSALQPDVVIMDVNMPGMNGIEATRVIRQRWPRVAVVGLSVQDEAGTAEVMREAGARAYLNKGGDSARLIDTVLATGRR